MTMACEKCDGRMFVDRVHTAADHLEIFCVICGARKMYHPPSQFKEIWWLKDAEEKLLKSYNGL